MEKVGAVEVESLVNQLRMEHAELEARLQELEHHVSLTPDEQFEIARIKKLKLATKDRLLRLMKQGRA